MATSYAARKVGEAIDSTRAPPATLGAALRGAASRTFLNAR